MTGDERWIRHMLVALSIVSMGTCLPSTASAAIISYAGRVQGTAGNDNDAVDRWRTTDVDKPLDPDGDNTYGTAGYVVYAVDTAGNGNGGSVASGNPLSYQVSATRRTFTSIPSYLSVTSTGQTHSASSYGYRLFDDPTLAPGTSVANVESGAALRQSTALGTEIGMVTFTINNSFPEAGLRIGMFANNADAYAGTIRLAQTTGSGSMNISVTQDYNPAIDLYFFDITNAAVGDVFTLYLRKDNPQPSSGNMNTSVIYGGLTFDVIPEPGTVTLIAVSGMVLVYRLRRRTLTKAAAQAPSKTDA